MKKKLISVLLALAMVFSWTPPTALAAEAAQTGFTDVSPDLWYAENVAYVYENGLMNGISETTFQPDTSLTRAMFVTILGRMDGVQDDVSYGGRFSDVEAGQWYTNYVAWGLQNDIITGYSAETFGTNDPITREQMAAIIARYVSYAGITLPETKEAQTSFTDTDSVSDYAVSGLELMRTTGILTGYEDGSFRPQNTATRAEAATIFTRLDRAVKGIVVEGPTPSEEPAEAPTEAPAEPSLPSEEPAETPIETPLPSEEPAETPIETPLPSEEPTETPIETPLPSEEPAETPAETPIPSEEPVPTVTPDPIGTPVASGTCGDGLTWTMDTKGVLVVSGSGPMWDFEAVLGDNQLVHQTPWDRDQITQVTLENGVTSIGSGAFSDCANLAVISIPTSVTKIGDYAFARCSALSFISLPVGVIEIGNSAFSDCDRLTSVVLPEGLVSIEDLAFADCTALTSLVIPSSVRTIGSGAFWSCESLTSVNIPYGITAIPDALFLGTASLRSVVIPNSVTSIGDLAFASCLALTSVTLPDGLVSIGSYAFYGCQSLTSLNIPASVTYIGDCAFLDSPLS